MSYPSVDYTPAQLAMKIEMRFELLENYLQRIFDQVDALQVCSSYFIVYMPHIREGHVVGSARKATGKVGAPAEGT
jgi:hypothetical protein